ncbi:aminodeoxychorismate lyase [Blochmannia endosymbiont of Colobopsis nipponica]|uniref:aminodeoxychorismate lyase n=1 Tax=Blochmannia endosymbiont of Colobopsis nipponica TaxID=2681987 RepID=UPI0017865F9F|nr:aminodeoxychorismate lyase [Blochmannia endosymbiont of Colobopsis nipponica]QOI11050.1 aminodeoxychorismate lyase [Blochmannia endosymbiont of Colobopsis nipponica]
MYWINGVFGKRLSLFNRAVQFGDGFFTTAKLKDNKILLLDWHIERLIMSAKRLLFNNINWSFLLKEIQTVADSNTDGVIKIIIARNNSINNCNYPNNGSSVRIIIHDKMPDYYVSWLQDGIKLALSPIKLVRDSVFSGIKHLNRIEQFMINAYRDKNISDEVLVLDTEDNIIECCYSNIFWRRNMKVFTPMLTHAGIFGIMRRLIMILLPKLGYQIKEIITGIEDIYRADEVFITNSLLPVVSVNSIEEKKFYDKTLFKLLSLHNFY